MVESEMATHPAVLECCVVGRKHEKWAEVGHAFVVLKQGQSADMETLKAHCRERMSKVSAAEGQVRSEISVELLPAQFAVPMYFDFVKELPKVRAASTSCVRHLLTASSDLHRKCVAIAPCALCHADPLPQRCRKMCCARALPTHRKPSSDLGIAHSAACNEC